ncbi:MAG: PIN domain-containing protein [Anaerolineae bacterium]|nr:PIN domain-containing protein [Anaerolineae bacterium]
MSTLLIGTSALHALNYARDDHHGQALVYFKSLAGRVKPILTEWVFVETMNLTKARLGPPYAIAFGRQLKTSRAFYPLVLTDEDKRAAWDIFEQHQDKQWSYVDCSLLAVAQRLKVKKIFAFDHHFQQMGLEVVP